MNIKIKNEEISQLILEDPDSTAVKEIFVFALGYEERSIEIFNKYFKDESIPKLCFLFKDYEKHEIPKQNKGEVEIKAVEPIEVEYKDYDSVISYFKKAVLELKTCSGRVNIHIDYSSMPRSWYCRLSFEALGILDKDDKVFFWYSKGIYVEQGGSLPSAGVEDVEVLVGKPSLRPTNNRSHIFGLGLDYLRSQAIYSVLDPAYLVNAYSHSSKDNTMRDEVLKVNSDLFSSAAYSVLLPMDDFSFSISKLTETVNELLFKGDVVLVPDGPKPLILALSMIPYIANKVGVICLHVKRHEGFFKPINVKATGVIYGFSCSKND